MAKRIPVPSVRNQGRFISESHALRYDKSDAGRCAWGRSPKVTPCQTLVLEGGHTRCSEESFQVTMTYMDVVNTFECPEHFACEQQIQKSRN